MLIYSSFCSYFGVTVGKLFNFQSLEGTLWGNDTDWGGAGTIIIGTVNVWGDPAFVDPDAGDYHLGPGSAAIDAGVNAGVTTDIDGNPRPHGGGFDLGADEYWPVAPGAPARISLVGDTDIITLALLPIRGYIGAIPAFFLTAWL